MSEKPGSGAYSRAEDIQLLLGPKLLMYKWASTCNPTLLLSEYMYPDNNDLSQRERYLEPRQTLSTYE